MAGQPPRRQRFDVCGSRLLRGAFDRTVMLHDAMTEFGQGRPAAVLASFLRGDDRDPV